MQVVDELSGYLHKYKKIGGFLKERVGTGPAGQNSRRFAAGIKAIRLSSLSLFLSFPEEFHQVKDVIAISVEMDMVHPGSIEDVVQMGDVFFSQGFISVPYVAAAGINENGGTGLHILDFQQADIGQDGFTRIRYGYSYQVMAAGKDAEGLFIVVINKV